MANRSRRVGGERVLLTAYREDGNDWRVEARNFRTTSSGSICLIPRPKNSNSLRRARKYASRPKEALSEIEASSRLILQRGVLYLSTPMVARGELQTTEISPAGFVLTPNLLVTVRFKDFSSFESVAERIRTDETLDCSVAIFTALLEAIVDRGADALEHLGTAVDKIRNRFFMRTRQALNIARARRLRLHQILSDIGINSHHLDQARRLPPGRPGGWPPLSEMSAASGYPNPFAPGCMPSPRM